MRFTDDSFDEHIQSTIGVDFKVRVYDRSSGDLVSENLLVSTICEAVAYAHASITSMTAAIRQR